VKEVRALLEKIPGLPDITRIDPLQGGSVNRTWKLISDSALMVLRSDTPLVKDLQLDRHRETEVLTAIAGAGLGPDLIWSDPDAGLLLTEFVLGDVWQPTDIRQPTNLSRLAEVLYQLHSLEISTKPIGLLAAARCYASVLASSEADRLAEEIEVLTVQPDTGSHCGLCHGDPVSGNMLFSSESDRLILLDWEYAGIGDTCFDLAVVINHHGLSEVEKKNFLGAYAGSVDELQLEAYSGIYLRLSALWLMVVCGRDGAPFVYHAALGNALARLNPL
jgi:aminoglycoside phosphotransferase (APT) family kinase protein